MACTHPPWSQRCPYLGLNFAGLSVRSLFSPMWCIFLNSKCTELFSVALILIFLYSLFLCFGGIKTCNHAKLRIGWLSYSLFIGTLIMPERNKVPLEVKNKGYYCHPMITIIVQIYKGAWWAIKTCQHVKCFFMCRLSIRPVDYKKAKNGETHISVKKNWPFYITSSGACKENWDDGGKKVLAEVDAGRAPVMTILVQVGGSTPSTQKI